MPSTITTYYIFAPGTKARSSQVNNNFANHRGDLLPISDSTATATHLTNNLGASDKRWLRLYADNVDFTPASATVNLILRGDTSNTAGAWLFQTNSATSARVLSTGFDGTTISPGTTPDTALTNTARILTSVTFTANGSWTVPAGITKIWCYGCGGGGGGGGGSGSAANGAGGGGGGGASLAHWSPVDVTPGDVLSITVGAAGPGGGGGTAGGGTATSGTVGGTTTVYAGAKLLFMGHGGLPGQFGTPAGTGGAGGISRPFRNPGGGAGGARQATASAGETPQNTNPGTAGTSTGTANSGGGGGSGAGSGYISAATAGNGGDGGNADADGAEATSSIGFGYGSGGGGGGGGGGASSGGTGQNGAAGILCIFWNKNA